jgi:hypothetical protein
VIYAPDHQSWALSDPTTREIDMTSINREIPLAKTQPSSEEAHRQRKDHLRNAEP